ncbi:hypothetical protein FHR24_002832 [Wenyingzhuangia heitensis]|uniref:Uncharacterized protein n=1 Tax=Wenyingzhuangia heitensis TaxID=1487859 RepID=A0ABX0UEP9_9FLAO|nr:hypothetical protein [Wenyingzhuangia heitensis]NIJ46345.1 hypothetical protein [Wenyingzhuangia heitensis]
MQNSSKYSSILLVEAGSKPQNEIKFFDSLGNRKTIIDLITRIKKEEGAEIVILKSGIEIPIERIHSVDKELSPYYSNDFFSCDCV